MALIKNIDATLYEYTSSSNTNAYDYTGIFSLNSTNTALIEDEDNETLWLNGIPHDRVSLVPKFNLPPKAFDYLKNNVINYFNNNILLTKQPSLHCSHDTYSSSTEEINSDIEFPKYSSWNNISNLSSNVPQYLTFQHNNEDYILYYHTAQELDSSWDYNLGDTKIYIVKTSDYSTYTDRLEIDTEGFTIPLHYDSTNNAIICLCFSAYQAADTTQGNSNIIKVAFRVLKIDFNPLSLNSSTYLDNFSTTYFDAINATPNPMIHTLYWAGYDSNNNNVLLYLENDNFSLKAANLDFSSNPPTFSTIDTPAHTISITGEQLNPLPGRFHQTNDPATPNIYFSFYPTFNNGNFQPVLIEWNKSLNLSSNQSPFQATAVQQANITYPQNTSSSDYIYHDTFNLIGSDINDYKGNLTAYSTCFITKSSANEYYLNFINVFKNKSAYSNMLTQPNSLNLVTFHMDDMVANSNPASLTFHQSIQIECLDLLIENDNATELVVISPNSIKFLNFSNIWQVTSQHNGIYTNYTKDALGRRWATKQPNATYLTDYTPFATYQNNLLSLINPEIELHLLDDTIPHRTSISFSTPNQTYVGSDLSNTLNVDAFDETGARIIASVFLAIEGNDMTFDSNSGTELTINTSNLQTTSVPVTITGPGHVSVAASFNI